MSESSAAPDCLPEVMADVMTETVAVPSLATTPAPVTAPVTTPAPAPALAGGRDGAAPASGTAVLADLIAAGLVTHEMIGDPVRLGGETAALRLLCALVAGPVWRIEPFHYAFRADPEGVPEARAAELEAALKAELGADAVWVSATERPEAADLDQPLLLLRAQAEAVQGALEPAGPEISAVIGARFAAAAARIAAGEGGLLDARLAAIEARQARILAAIEARAVEDRIEERAGAETLGRLAVALAQVLQRLDAQAEALGAQAARETLVAGRLAELAAMAGAPAAFQAELGLALAEFLARIENREALAMTPVAPVQAAG